MTWIVLPSAFVSLPFAGTFWRGLCDLALSLWSSCRVLRLLAHGCQVSYGCPENPGKKSVLKLESCSKRFNVFTPCTCRGGSTVKETPSNRYSKHSRHWRISILCVKCTRMLSFIWLALICGTIIVYKTEYFSWTRNSGVDRSSHPCSFAVHSFGQDRMTQALRWSDALLLWQKGAETCASSNTWI